MLAFTASLCTVSLQGFLLNFSHHGLHSAVRSFRLLLPLFRAILTDTFYRRNSVVEAVCFESEEGRACVQSTVVWW